MFDATETAARRACAAAQQFHHAKLLDAGVRILEYPTMLHAKAFARDGEELHAGTCNLEAWSLRRFFEIDIGLRSAAVAAQFDERFLVHVDAGVARAGEEPCPNQRKLTNHEHARRQDPHCATTVCV